jgi:hypothetical protein
LIMTTPTEARKLAEYRGHEHPATHIRDALRDLADQVEALTAQLDSYAMALNETKAERDAREKLAREQAEHAHAARIEAERIQREQIVQAQAARIREEQTLTLATAPPCHQTVVPEVGRVQPIKIIEGNKPAILPSLKLGTIAERLGFSLTAEFLASIGFEPAAKIKGATLFHEDDFPLICNALIAHINEVCETA